MRWLVYLALGLGGFFCAAEQIACRYTIDSYVACKKMDSQCHDGLIRVALEDDEFHKEIKNGGVTDFEFSGKHQETQRFIFGGFTAFDKLVDMQIRDGRTAQRSSGVFDPEKKFDAFELILSQESAGGFDVHLGCQLAK